MALSRRSTLITLCLLAAATLIVATADEHALVSRAGPRHGTTDPVDSRARLVRRHVDDDGRTPGQSLHVSCADARRFRRHAANRWAVVPDGPQRISLNTSVSSVSTALS